MTDSGQAIIDWYEKKGYSYSEPYNEKEAQTQLNQILEVAKDKARTTKEADKFREGTPIGRGIDSTISDDLERLNREYISEISPNISSTVSSNELQKISIDERYEQRTVNRLKAQFGARMSYFKRIESVKEDFLSDPDKESRLRRYRRWSAVQDYFKLTDTELQQVKRELGEDFLK